jgi:4-amino-4-deoxy-L-arabinose transferase-like glycosyltransferase
MEILKMVELWYMKHRYETIIFALILLTAVFFRFWQLDLIPPGLYPDEAMNGNNALEALTTGDFKVFYPDNNGREGLFINIQAISVALFGNTAWSLRVVSAIFGTLTVVGLYLLVKRMMGFQIAAISAFGDFIISGKGSLRQELKISFLVESCGG